MPRRPRAASDPDYRWLHRQRRPAAEKTRALKTLSLNLAERQRERESLDAMRLALENARRKALQQLVLTAPDAATRLQRRPRRQRIRRSPKCWSPSRP